MSLTCNLHLNNEDYDEIEVRVRAHPSIVRGYDFNTLTIAAQRPGMPLDEICLYLSDKQLDHILHECAKLYEERLAKQRLPSRSQDDSCRATNPQGEEEC